MGVEEPSHVTLWANDLRYYVTPYLVHLCLVRGVGTFAYHPPPEIPENVLALFVQVKREGKQKEGSRQPEKLKFLTVCSITALDYPWTGNTLQWMVITLLLLLQLQQQ